MTTLNYDIGRLSEPFDVMGSVSTWNTPLVDTASLSEIVESHPDLFGYRAIHVSAGINKNDIYFDPTELWKARFTPAHKKVNFEHDDEFVFGHLVNSCAVDAALADVQDGVPESVRHIITYGVIYGKWNNVDLEKQVHAVIQDIKDGKFKVSMESLSFGQDILCVPMEYSNVKDYEGIKKLLDSGLATIIPNEQMTDEIKNSTRKYGGNGTYNGKRVYIFAKDILFIGQGVVKNPANTDSIILDYAEGVTLNQSETKEYVMSKANTDAANTASAEDVATLKASLDALTAEYNKAKSEWDEEKKGWWSEKSGFEKLKAEVEQAKAEATSQVASLSEKFSAAETELAAMKEKCEMLMKEKAAWEQEKADKAKAEKMLARVSVLQEKAGLDVETARDMASVEMDDASFNKVVGAMGKVKQSTQVTASTDTASATLDSVMGKAPVDTAAASTSKGEVQENYQEKILGIFDKLFESKQK